MLPADSRPSLFSAPSAFSAFFHCAPNTVNAINLQRIARYVTKGAPLTPTHISGEPMHHDIQMARGEARLH